MANSHSRYSAMSSKQKIYFTPTNLTKSLKVSSASYIEEEKQIKNSAGSIILLGVRKDYLFTVNNISSKVIDAIRISFRQNGVLKSTYDWYYKYNRNGIQPEESVEIQIPGVEPDYTPAVEAIIFRDGSYEGDKVLAEALIARFKAADAKIAGLMTLFKDRNLLSLSDNMIIPNNVKEIRVHLDSEYEKNRMKTDHRDIYDFHEHQGESDGIIFVDGCLKQLEQTPDQQGMQIFINRLTGRLKEVEGN